MKNKTIFLILNCLTTFDTDVVVIAVDDDCFPYITLIVVHLPFSSKSSGQFKGDHYLNSLFIKEVIKMNR